MNPEGDWNVDIDPEVPDHVRLQFAEWDEDGAESYTLYMTPEGAIEYAKSIEEVGKYLLGELDG